MPFFLKSHFNSASHFQVFVKVYLKQKLPFFESLILEKIKALDYWLIIAHITQSMECQRV